MGSMKGQDYLILGGAAVAAYLIMKKNLNPLTQAQAALSNTLGDLQAALARFMPTNTAGGTINTGSTGTGPINDISEQINMGLLSSSGQTAAENNAVARAISEPAAWQSFLDWEKTAKQGDVWSGYYGPGPITPTAIIAGILSASSTITSAEAMKIAGTVAPVNATPEQVNYAAQQASYAAAAIGTPAPVPIYTAAYISTLPTSAETAKGGAYQSGNGGYNTGIKYF